MNDVNDNEQGAVKRAGWWEAHVPVLTVLVMLVAAAVFVWQQVDLDWTTSLLAPGAAVVRGGRWDAVLTSVFAHGDALHIAFNLLWVWVLGRVLEANLSKGLWLVLFFTCALFASAAELAWEDQLGIGLSGVVYGWAAFMWSARGRYPAFREVMNKQTVLWLVGWLVFSFVMTKLGKMQVASAAHIGGAVAGVLIGWVNAGSAGRRAWRSTADAPVGKVKGGTISTVLACLGLLALAVGSAVYAPWAASYNAAAAMKAFEAKDYAKARVTVDRLLKSKNDYTAWATILSADIYARQGDKRAMAAQYEKMYPELKDEVNYLNSYAWLLATCPDPAVRNGKRAVEVATRAAEVTQWKHVVVLDTLAAAYAEAGNMPEAVKWQTKVNAMMPFGQQYQERLALYKAGKAFHEKE